MKYLIVGLGNPGYEYDGTRHNIGFRVVDALAREAGATWEDKRYGFVANMRVKNAQIVLLKPITFMNLSGNAVRYWLEKENVATENLLVVVDDLSLPTGTLRLRAKGSDGGHNGLKHIAQLIGQNYARLKFGIGNDFPRGAQADFVLGRFSSEDEAIVEKQLPTACAIVKSFCLAGITITMNQYNKKGVPSIFPKGEDSKTAE